MSNRIRIPHPHDEHGNLHAWHPHHIEAGYHKQKWEVPSASAGIIGTYDCADGTVLVISHLPVGTLGPAELLLDYIDGPKLTVLDEATALEYLLLHAAKRRA